MLKICRSFVYLVLINNLKYVNIYVPTPPPPPRLDLVLAQGNRLENLESTLYEDAFIVISQEEGLMFLKRKLSISFSYILIFFYALLWSTSDAHILVLVSLFRLLRISFLHKSFNENIAISVVILKRKGFKTHTILSLLRFSHLSRGFDLLFNKLETPFDKDIVFLVWLN